MVEEVVVVEEEVKAVIVDYMWPPVVATAATSTGGIRKNSFCSHCPSFSWFFSMFYVAPNVKQ